MYLGTWKYILSFPEPELGSSIDTHFCSELPFQKSKDMIGNKGRKKKQFVVCSFSGLLAAGLTSQFLSQTSMKKIKKIKKKIPMLIYTICMQDTYAQGT